MLKKLIKYDLENIYKGLIIFYILSLFFAILTRIFLNIDDSFIMNIIGKICSGVTISMIFNILINNLMRSWVRFKQNLYGDESYLTHTLPVNKKNIYLSKIITGIVTLLTSTIVIGVCLFIAYYSKENITLLKNILFPFVEAYNSTIIKVVLACIFLIFLEFLNLLQTGYTGVILGHRVNNHKNICSVLFGFLSYSITQTFVLLILFITALFNKEIMNLFFTSEIVNLDIMKTIFYIAMIGYTLIIIINYFVNVKLFKKGVNVD